MGIFPKWGTPPPPPPCLGMTCFFLKKIWFILHFRTFFGGVSHVKNSEKWKWDLGRPPPPVFFKIPTFSRFFLADAPKGRPGEGKAILLCGVSDGNSDGSL